jgi:hypothetical protein
VAPGCPGYDHWTVSPNLIASNSRIRSSARVCGRKAALYDREMPFHVARGGQAHVKQGGLVATASASPAA